jgi:CheY-like chemotaxis protein
MRKAMRSYLETAGFKVLEAADGVEAIEQARWSKPDVVVLDLAMPRMNGFDVARKLHRVS